jgi:hypothetical protein
MRCGTFAFFSFLIKWAPDIFIIIERYHHFCLGSIFLMFMLFIAVGK